MTSTEKRPKNSTRYAVILHLYYMDLWPEISSHLSRIPLPFDLYVTTTHEKINDAKKQVLPQYPHAFIFAVENRGRDIAPFLDVLSRININQYDAICKLHSKKSARLRSGERWRKDLYNKLLGSPDSIASILHALTQNKLLGIIAPTDHIVSLKNALGDNLQNISKLTQKLGIKLNIDTTTFVAGSMFWFKPDAISPLINLRLLYQDFETESNQFDGTMAHAVERLFSLVGFNMGYWMIDTGIVDQYRGIIFDKKTLTALCGKNNNLSTRKRYEFSEDLCDFQWESTTFENHVYIHKDLKRIYQSRFDLRATYPNPIPVFNVCSSFYLWLIQTSKIEGHEVDHIDLFKNAIFQNGAAFKKIHLDIYESRLDLKALYPYLFATYQSRSSFYFWLLSQGVLEYPALNEAELLENARFENGAFFKKSYLEIYRSRPDLQVKYPNPFSTHELNHSYYHWLTTQGPLEYSHLN